MLDRWPGYTPEAQAYEMSLTDHDARCDESDECECSFDTPLPPHVYAEDAAGRIPCCDEPRYDHPASEAVILAAADLAQAQAVTLPLGLA